jgi:hypothetical protein
MAVRLEKEIRKPLRLTFRDWSSFKPRPFDHLMAAIANSFDTFDDKLILFPLQMAPWSLKP